jgi:choline dehydrogenase-like flavoprotein
MAVLARLADPASGLWEACGYQPFPLGLAARRHPVRPDTIALAEAHSHYDVVVIGSGAGGGVAARVLAEAGASVLIVERGRWTDRDAPGMDHLRNHRGPLLGDGTSPATQPCPPASTKPAPPAWPKLPQPAPSTPTATSGAPSASRWPTPASTSPTAAPTPRSPSWP